MSKPPSRAIGPGGGFARSPRRIQCEISSPPLALNDPRSGLSPTFQTRPNALASAARPSFCTGALPASPGVGSGRVPSGKDLTVEVVSRLGNYLLAVPQKQCWSEPLARTGDQRLAERGAPVEHRPSGPGADEQPRASQDGEVVSNRAGCHGEASGEVAGTGRGVQRQ